MCKNIARPLRDSLMDSLIYHAGYDNRICVVDCDVARHTRADWFREKYPNRFYELGICEQNAVGFSAGLASMGKRPVVTGFAGFLATRAWEQIEHSVVYNNSPVVLIATHGGLSAGEDGATHQRFQDISLVMSIPSMNVLLPAFPSECDMAIRFALKSDKPTYIRVGRDVCTESPWTFNQNAVGDPIVLHSGLSGIALISTGEITHESIEACKELLSMGISVTHVHIGSLRPFNSSALFSLLGSDTDVITVEEHGKVGGLFACIACESALQGIRLKSLTPLYINSEFGQSGKRKELVDVYGIGSKTIVQTCLRIGNED